MLITKAGELDNSLDEDSESVSLAFSREPSCLQLRFVVMVCSFNILRTLKILAMGDAGYFIP